MMNSNYPTTPLATTPKSMPIRSATVHKSQTTPSHGRKQSSRNNKRSKKKIQTSSDEDMSDYSGDDY